MKIKTMTIQEIKEDIAKGWKPEAFGDKDGYICEITFTTKKLKDCQLAGFSFMCCELRQRELKSLFNRIKKVVPKFRLQY